MRDDQSNLDSLDNQINSLDAPIGYYCVLFLLECISSYEFSILL